MNGRSIYEYLLHVIWPILGLDRGRVFDKMLFNEDRKVVGRYISHSIVRWATDRLLAPKNQSKTAKLLHSRFNMIARIMHRSEEG